MAEPAVGVASLGAFAAASLFTSHVRAEGPDRMSPPDESRRVRQPVEEYFNVYSPKSAGPQKIEMAVNPFLAYTHLGSDFGFIGTGEEYIGWQPGIVCVDMPDKSWGGMWHGLAGVGDDMDVLLNFNACYPSFIQPQYQPQIVGLELRAKGKGALKVDIKTCTEDVRWSDHFDLDATDVHSYVKPLNPAAIGQAKYLNWVAEGGTNACVDSIGFIVKTPNIPFDEYVFLASYAKLARCYSEHNGYVSDRAHSRDGYFENVPTCGLFCLNTAIANSLGMVSDAAAQKILHRTHENICKLDAPHGLLPHFVKSGADGVFHILPGTEYSVVDTSLYYHAMLLAAKILHDDETSKSLTDSVQKIDLGALLDANGYIKHGLREDGNTPLPSVWRDWGGETALVLAMNAMTSNPVPPKMDTSGHFYQGTGFLAEVQSLFYHQFDSDTLDAVTKQNWHAARLSLFERQKNYPQIFLKDTPAAKAGFYGLSAGEGLHGFGYLVDGVDLPNEYIIHPHYMLMSACLEKDPATIYALLRKMEDAQLFPPWGMVEHFTATTLEYLPMQGALNAAFEGLGAYHLLAKNRKIVDAVYDAADKTASLRKGIATFYPATLTKL